jgi:predicted AAA+ superfamily ATPase
VCEQDPWQALRTSYLVRLLPPYHKNFNKRLRKRPKLHFLDTGLACSLGRSRVSPTDSAGILAHAT